jgi:hypothetical protein
MHSVSTSVLSELTRSSCGSDWRLVRRKSFAFLSVPHTGGPATFGSSFVPCLSPTCSSECLQWLIPVLSQKSKAFRLPYFFEGLSKIKVEERGGTASSEKAVIEQSASRFGRPPEIDF